MLSEIGLEKKQGDEEVICSLVSESLLPRPPTQGVVNDGSTLLCPGQSACWKTCCSPPRINVLQVSCEVS